ncbi:uncharacterized protein LOC144914753 [Branchiostoma floridae x Branchiostoma belcheri]
MKTMKRLLVVAIFVVIAGMAVEGMFFNKAYLNKYNSLPRPELEGTQCGTDDDCAPGECCTKYKRCRPIITKGLCHPYKIMRKETCDCEDGFTCQVFRHLRWKEIYNQEGSCIPEDQARELELKTYDEWSDKNPSAAKIWLGNKFRNRLGVASGVLWKGGRGRKRRSAE